MLHLDGSTRFPGASANPPPAARIVIDTNVLLDWWVFEEPAACALGHAVADGRLEWIYTAAMRQEWMHVLARPLSEQWESARKRAHTNYDSTWGLAVADAPAAPPGLVCSDPADQMFIDLAFAHRVPWLVSRDRAVLRLARAVRRWGVQILSPALCLAAALPEGPAADLT